MKNLLVVRSPFQMLSAIECANYFSKDENTIIVCSTANVKNNKQIVDLLKIYSDWHGVVSINPSRFDFLAGIKMIVALKAILGSKIKYDRVFVGDCRSWQMMQFFYTLNPEECYSLDDGNATIAMQNNKFSQTFENVKTNGIRELLKKGLLKLLGMRSGGGRTINLFTCFDLKPFSHIQKVITHDFDFIKSHNGKKLISSDTIYFFGAPLSEQGIVTLETELNSIQYIKEYFSKKELELFYIPHRADSEQKIQLIKSELSIDIDCFLLPAEIEIVSRDELPLGIASFYSTVLLTLPKLYEFNLIAAFKIQEFDILESYRKEIEQVYIEYSNRLNVIEINNSL